jgi:hypothetical protein
MRSPIGGRFRRRSRDQRRDFNEDAPHHFSPIGESRSGTFLPRGSDEIKSRRLRPLRLYPLPFSRGICWFRGCAARTGGRARIWSRSSRWNSKNPSDRACSRPHRAAHDGTDRAGCLTTSLGTVLSTTDRSLSTCNAGSCQHHEQGCPEGYFAHVALPLIDLRLENIPLAGKMFRCEHFLVPKLAPGQIMLKVAVGCQYQLCARRDEAATVRANARATSNQCATPASPTAAPRRAATRPCRPARAGSRCA